MEYNIPALRKLVQEAFNDEEFSIFCYDHFRPIHDQFTAGQSRVARIQMLIEYAERHNRLGEIEEWVAKGNSQKYAEVAHLLHTSPEPTTHSPQIPTTLQPHDSSLSHSQELSDASTHTERNNQQIVLLIHGIRTRAYWQEMVVQALNEKDTIIVIPIRYGRLDAFRFWFPWYTRQRSIEKILRRIRTALKNYPTARLSIVAHSFGTYAIAKIIEDNPEITIFRLIFCGSIVSQDFRWDKFVPNQVGSVINECGARDVWPVLAQSTTWGYGDSGTFGFGQQVARVHDRFHNYRHSDYFNVEFVKDFWKPYIKNGEIVELGVRPPSPFWLETLRLFSNKYSVILVIAIVLLWSLCAQLSIDNNEVPAGEVRTSSSPISHASSTPPVDLQGTLTPVLTQTPLVTQTRVRIVSADFFQCPNQLNLAADLRPELEKIIGDDQLINLQVTSAISDSKAADQLVQGNETQVVIWGSCQNDVVNLEVDFTALPELDDLLFEPLSFRFSGTRGQVRQFAIASSLYAHGRYRDARAALGLLPETTAGAPSAGSRYWLQAAIDAHEESFSSAIDSFGLAIEEHADPAEKAILHANLGFVRLQAALEAGDRTIGCRNEPIAAYNDALSIASHAENAQNFQPLFQTGHGYAYFNCPPTDDNMLVWQQVLNDTSAGMAVGFPLAYELLAQAQAVYGEEYDVETNACEALHRDPSLALPHRTLGKLFMPYTTLQDRAQTELELYLSQARLQWQRDEAHRLLEDLKNVPVTDLVDAPPGLGKKQGCP